jgi:hypothetical protein
MKSLTEKVIAYQTTNTPRADYLAHYYWGNRWWSKIGAITALAILLFSKFFFIVNWYFLPIAFLPKITATIAGKTKEKRDATGLGNVDSEDIKYTVMPSHFDVVWLVIVIICLVL